jgi:hypothetical protein
MAAKKKVKKKQAKSKPRARKKTPAKRTAAKRKTSKKSVKTTARKAKKASKRQVRKRSQTVDVAFSGARQVRPSSGQQSGDLQGLSRAEGADSESVDELLEEGNPFEAEVVTGVEDADDTDEKEVHTHEVPEDDVPEEYLDKD